MKTQDVALLLPLIMGGLLYYPEFRTEIYMTLTVFMFSWTFFHKFPSFVLSGYKKPLYFEDLLASSPKYINNFQPAQRKKFEMIFTHVMAFVCAIIIAGIFDYSLHRIQIKDAQIVGLLGTVGGLYAIYKKIKKFFGNKLLSYLCKKKRSIIINSEPKDIKIVHN